MRRRVNRKVSINKKRRIIFYSLFFALFFITVGYSYLSATLSINSHVVISADHSIPVNRFFQTLAPENSCITKYEGLVTDRVGITETANNVYFNKCTDKRNIIFGGFCWQVIRSTETGGLKMIYNGEPVDGKCESTRSDHKGILQTNYNSQFLNSSYLYGSSFTYDVSSGEFTLVDTFTETWSNSTYENLIGKFTCKTSNNTCTTLYQINGYKTYREAYASAYTIGDTSYSQVGTSSFNSKYDSSAMAGYMFNKIYEYVGDNWGNLNGTYKYGSSFTYDANTNTYTLSGTTQTITGWFNAYNVINDTHYTCWNDTGSCTTLSYIYRTWRIASSDGGGQYFNLTDGKDVGDLLNEMLYSSDVNRYNSSIKGIVDNWYAKNLTSSTSLFDDAVYCNDRSISSLGGFNPNGGDVVNDYQLKFKNYNDETSLECTNQTDQFALSNNKAMLMYPVGLLQDEERSNINTTSLMNTGKVWWELSPSYYDGGRFGNRRILSDGTSGATDVNFNLGVRPVVTLGSENIINGGSGTETDPWTVDSSNYENMIGTYSGNLRDTYLSDTYRNKIKTITLHNSVYVPNDAVISWDIGSIHNGKVMAYLKTNPSDNTMYDLYIEGDGALYSNYNSYKLFYNMPNLETINNLTLLDTSKTTNMSYMFADNPNLTSLDVTNLNTDNVTNMQAMFAGDKTLTSLDISNFNTSLVTNMSRMFSGHLDDYYDYHMALSSIIGIESINTSAVKSMQGMFMNCGEISSLDLSAWNTENVKSMRNMFNNVNDMPKLTTINFGASFNTSSVTDMFRMFANNTALTNLDVSMFDTTNVTNMGGMFDGDTNLSSLNLSNFNTTNVINMHGMFKNCSNLINLNIGNFTFNSVQNFELFANGMPSKAAGAQIRVKDNLAKSWILNLTNSDRPSDWDATNIIIN